MTVDVSHLSTAQISLLGIVATLMAALVAAFAALSVALVNFYAARHLARYRARFEYRQTLFKPLTNRLDSEVEYYQKIVEQLLSISSGGIESAALLISVQQHIVRGLPGAVTRTMPLAITYLLSRESGLMKARNIRLYDRFEKLQDFRLRFLTRVQNINANWRNEERGPSELANLIEDARGLIKETLQIRIALDSYTVG